MKKIVKLLFVCAIVISLPTLWTAVKAQTSWNSVCDYVGIAGNNLTTIVREHGSEQFVVYAADTSKSFCLVDMNGATIKDVSLPTSISVNDFEILDGMVYFCGEYSTSTIVGWFHVDSLFKGHSQIWYLPLPPSLPCPDSFGGLDIISKLTRITPAMFNGQVHMLLTGEATCNVSPTLNHCLVDVYHNRKSWMMAYHQDNTGIYYYDDIEVTATEIAIVGHKENTNGEYMQSYVFPGVNQDIFAAQIPPYPIHKYTYSYGGSDYIPDMHKDILAEWIDSSKFVTVTYGERFVYPNLIQGTFLNIYYSVGNLASRWFISEHCTGNRELRYNSVTNSIMLLFDSCSMSWGDGYVEYRLNSARTMVTSAWFHSELGGGSYSSLDVCPSSFINGRTVLTGESPTHNLRIWHHIDVPSPNCATHVKLTITQVPMGPNSHNQYIYYSDHSLSAKYIRVKIIEKDLEIPCEEESE